MHVGAVESIGKRVELELIVGLRTISFGTKSGMRHMLLMITKTVVMAIMTPQPRLRVTNCQNNSCAREIAEQFKINGWYRGV